MDSGDDGHMTPVSSDNEELEERTDFLGFSDEEAPVLDEISSDTSSSSSGSEDEEVVRGGGRVRRRRGGGRRSVSGGRRRVGRRGRPRGRSGSRSSRSRSPLAGDDGGHAADGGDEEGGMSLKKATGLKTLPPLPPTPSLEYLVCLALSLPPHLAFFSCSSRTSFFIFYGGD